MDADATAPPFAVPAELEPLVIGRDPLTLRLENGRLGGAYRGAFLFAAAMIATLGLAVLGWVGVFAMHRDVFSLVATAAAIGFAGYGLAILAPGRWGVEELTLEPDRLVLRQRVGPLRRTRELRRSWTERVATGRADSDADLDFAAGAWLIVVAEPPARDLLVGHNLALPARVRRPLAELIERWRSDGVSPG